MIKYKLFLKNPASHYIYVDLIIDNVSADTLNLQLPAWRPGRYELGNFAKNIKRVDAFDEKGGALEFFKSSKDLWHVKTNGASTIKVTYSYFAAELNAGACYADETQLYVNPVHLCMYVPERMNESCEVELEIPDNYKIACGLSQKGKTLFAKNTDELVDSPFMASAEIKTDFYEVNGIKFFIHFNGECKPDWEKIKKDFAAFTKAEIDFWGDFPVNEYHFIIQVLDHKFYHGVEHQKSTVIALGPGYHLNEGKTYEDLLGVCSHELFHTWNIKFIRPSEMLPYNLTKENYARTGYVYEGFTTYYGDLMLGKSNVFTPEQYFETLEERLLKHFHNYGRFNLSVADSSLDNWLDGYVPGAPYRKTSIYDEGNLVAFMLDVLILKNTQNKKSLKDVCRILYNDFGKNNRGYTEQDIISICEATAGTSLREFFKNCVYGTMEYETELADCFEYLGIEMQKLSNPHLNEMVFGFKASENAHLTKVTLIAPHSPAWKSGLAINDDIIAVNSHAIRNDLNNWLNYYKNEPVELTVTSSGQVKTLPLNVSGFKSYFDIYKLKLKQNRTEEQKNSFKNWLI